MRTITPAARDLIDAIVAEIDIDASLLEKDVHVTDVLHELFKLKFPNSRFVFCGGTSLSKAFGVIERMSEDVDLKIALNPGHCLTRSGLRTYLKGVNEQVKAAMAKMGFEEDPDGSKVLNEYRYCASSWLYNSVYSSSTALRPHLSLEFTVREPRFDTHQAPVYYLMERFTEPPKEPPLIECVAIEETLSEKVLSFLRRHSMHRAGVMKQEWDGALVRHIYDVYCILQQYPLAAQEAAAHFGDLVEVDKAEFKNYPAFVEDAKGCLTSALNAAENEEQTLTEYTGRLMPLVYGEVRPDFHTAFAAFKNAAGTLLSGI